MVIEERIFVAASAARVWDIVADPIRMTSLSPEVDQIEWVGEPGAHRGATFLGHNRFGPVRWTTTNFVEVAEPVMTFGWRAVEGNDRCVSRWTYHIERQSGGCEVVERYESVGWMATAECLLGRAWMLRRGMRRTLRRLKIAAQSAAKG